MEDHTKSAIAAFLKTADRDRPLLICDADEVLLQFFETLEGFLDRQGYHVRLESFALHGNVRERKTGAIASNDVVSALMQEFFKSDIHTSAAVEGAPEALSQLSSDMTVCVLTNLPGAQAQRRAASLAQVGMAYPVICNTGGKGRAVEALVGSWRRDAAFIDDLPPNHDSVAQHAPDVHRIHYVASPRLAPLIEKPDSAHVRLHDWDALHSHLAHWSKTA
ncbi:MAG: hypothetical protein AAF221_08755 [Pseudomonadota bacterium]